MNLYESIKSNSNKSINDAWWKTNYQRAIDYVDSELPEILVDEFYGGDWDTYNCDSGKHVALTVLNQLGPDGFEKRLKEIKESDSSFDVEGLADRIDILMSDMDPYEHMDVYGSYNPTEESYQDTLDSLYNNPQSVLDGISSYDIIDWEDDIQTEYNEIIQDLKEWIKISRVKNESEDSSKKGYWVKIKMKNNKQVLHLFNTEDEMYEYLNLLSHYVGQGEVEILDYTGKGSKKNESEVKPTDEEFARYKDLMSKANEKEKDIRIKAGSQAVMLDDLSDEAYNTDYYKRVYGWSDDDLNLVNKVDSYINSSTPRFVVYTTSEIAPGEFKTDVYGKYTSSEQASDVCGELRSKGIGARVVTESSNPYAPTDEDWEDINHWYNDNYKEVWDNPVDSFERWKEANSDKIASYYTQTYRDDLKNINQDVWDSIAKDIYDEERLPEKINKDVKEGEQLRRYRVTLKHDNGKVSFITTASTKEQAIKQVCELEKAPESAVVKVVDKGSVVKESVIQESNSSKRLEYFEDSLTGYGEEVPEELTHKWTKKDVKAWINSVMNKTKGLYSLDDDCINLLLNHQHKLYKEARKELNEFENESFQTNNVYVSYGGYSIYSQLDTNGKDLYCEVHPKDSDGDVDVENLVDYFVLHHEDFNNASEKDIEKAMLDYVKSNIKYYKKNESEDSNITYLNSDTILDDLGSDYECISAMYDALGFNTDEEFFPETISTDADNSNLYIRNVDGKTEWVLNKNGKAVVCAGRDSANIPIVYFDNEIVKESDDEDDKYVDPNYKVDTSNLCLTNGGYHNNSDIIYGRVKLSSKKKSLPPGGQYDVIYFCENSDLYLYEVGSDVQGAVKWLYTMDGTNEDEWIKWDGSRVQLKNFWDILRDDSLKNEPDVKRESIEVAINKAYFEEEPFPLNKVNYQ